jgi:hypothetical protein
MLTTDMNLGIAAARVAVRADPVEHRREQVGAAMDVADGIGAHALGQAIAALAVTAQPSPDHRRIAASHMSRRAAAARSAAVEQQRVDPVKHGIVVIEFACEMSV